MKIIVHERPQDRGSWSPHGIDGWYVGPALNHYCCHRTYIPATNAIRISDTVSWVPHGIKMPTSSATDLIVAAAKDLTHALQQTTQSPILPPANTETRKALATLTTLFSNRIPTLKNSLPLVDPHSLPANPLPRVPVKHVPPFKPPQMPALPSVPSAALPRVPAQQTSGKALPRVLPPTPLPTPAPTPASPAPNTTAAYFNISTNRKRNCKK